MISEQLESLCDLFCVQNICAEYLYISTEIGFNRENIKNKKHTHRMLG